MENTENELKENNNKEIMEDLCDKALGSTKVDVRYCIECVDVPIELLNGGILPKYRNNGDAGMDVYASKNIIIKPGWTVKVPTGIKLAIPLGYEVQVRPRSGISLNTPLRIANAPGTLDSGFRGEIEIIFTNTTHHMAVYSSIPHTLENETNEPGIYEIRKGDRIAQLVLHRVPMMKLNVVDSVSEIGQDRGGGFGSSGITD